MYRYISAPFPREYMVLRLSPQTPGSQVLSQYQQNPSPPLRLMFFKTSYRLQTRKKKQSAQTPLSSLKKDCALSETLKIKSCNLLQQVTSEQTADSPADRGGDLPPAPLAAQN